MERLIDFSNASQKRDLLNRLNALQGLHRVEVVKHRKRRSDRQNRYYWPCFVTPFAEYMQAQGEAVTVDDAHELLKAKFLKRSVVDRRSGELMEFIGSTSTLDTAEFNKYLDQCAQWLSDFFNIYVPEPGEYRETEVAA